jgi:hypothetical protein
MATLALARWALSNGFDARAAVTAVVRTGHAGA